VRYRQFCALARAAELLGERWTLLIVRELLLGPKRFVDLRQRLDGLSPSVLTARLAAMEAAGLVRRRALPAPAPATVYELAEAGAALEPAIHELIRWGGRFLFPRRRGERAEPDWMRLALTACARRTPTPARAYELEVVERGGTRTTLRVTGGAAGTTLEAGGGPADAKIVADVPGILALMGGPDPAAAVRAHGITVSGDRAAVQDFPRLFDTTRRRPTGRPGATPKEARA